jgi:hypothetical protein
VCGTFTLSDSAWVLSHVERLDDKSVAVHSQSFLSTDNRLMQQL